MFHDKVVAAIRTACSVWVPLLITAGLSWLLDHGIEVNIDENTQLVLAGAAFAILVGLFNLVVNLLAEHVWPGFGWLLGVNKAPSYAQLNPEE